MAAYSCMTFFSIMKGGNNMPNSVIRKLDEQGEFHDLANYTLEPKQALIAYYMQNEKKTFNTWDYPDHIDAIRERTMGLGFFYEKGEDIIYSRPEEAVTI
jgi:hypothetical protein